MIGDLPESVVSSMEQYFAVSRSNTGEYIVSIPIYEPLAGMYVVSRNVRPYVLINRDADGNLCVTNDPERGEKLVESLDVHEEFNYKILEVAIRSKLRSLGDDDMNSASAVSKLLLPKLEELNKNSESLRKQMEHKKKVEMIERISQAAYVIQLSIEDYLDMLNEEGNEDESVEDRRARLMDDAARTLFSTPNNTLT